VHAKAEEQRTLAELFAQYGVEAFLEATSALVAILDKEGNLLSYNASFEEWKQNMPICKHLQDCLSMPSRILFDEFLKKTLHERVRKQANLEFAGDHHWGDFSTTFIPLPDKQVLVIAEPVYEVNDLQTITAELEKIKRSLAIKETELKAVIAQADEVSHTDALTFLPNRKRIIADLQHEVLFSDRYGTPLSISLLDIDHFKYVNDNYGHVAGDEVLRKLAMELRDHIRHPDTIGRYGGEEFLVVLPHSTIKAASEQAERLCKYVQSLAIPCEENEIVLTLSIGVAQYKTQKENWQSFLSRADQALYQAKNKGRNRWMVAEE
jgi:diguanylate cyclase (GGDEF)-like protein